MTEPRFRPRRAGITLDFSRPGKTTDSRSAAFIAKHGELRQVEIDALPPDTLQELYQAGIDEFVNKSTLEDVIALEQTERESLTA